MMNVCRRPNFNYELIPHFVASESTSSNHPQSGITAKIVVKRLVHCSPDAVPEDSWRFRLVLQNTIAAKRIKLHSDSLPANALLASAFAGRSRQPGISQTLLGIPLGGDFALLRSCNKCVLRVVD